MTKAAKRLTRFAAFFYALICGAVAQAQAPVEASYRTVGGHTLAAYVFQPTPAAARRPAVLLFHGGGWSSGAPDWVFDRARSFAALGLTAIAVEYRRAGPDATPADAVDDGCAALVWARRNGKRYDYDAARIAAYGVSAGGQIAATMSARGCGAFGRPEALLLWSAALNVRDDGYFRRLLRGADPLPYSPVDLALSEPPPTIIVQGELDTLTRVRDARRFCDHVRAAARRCDLHIFPRLGHLLTRNLKDQENTFDVDPVARATGVRKQDRFLIDLWPDLGGARS